MKIVDNGCSQCRRLEVAVRELWDEKKREQQINTRLMERIAALEQRNGFGQKVQPCSLISRMCRRILHGADFWGIKNDSAISEGRQDLRQ